MSVQISYVTEIVYLGLRSCKMCCNTATGLKTSLYINVVNLNILHRPFKFALYIFHLKDHKNYYESFFQNLKLNFSSTKSGTNKGTL